MSNRLDLTGKKFSSWEVIEFSEMRKHGSYWKCECKCGNKRVVRGSSLTSGASKSCDLGECKYNGLPNGIANFNHIYRYYKHNAKLKNLEFKLTQKQFKNITSKNCHYCNGEPNNEYKAKSTNGSFIYNGIDRKNNKKGYTIRNSLPCCKKCNFLKKDMSYKEFTEHIYTISSNLKRRKNADLL